MMLPLKNIIMYLAFVLFLGIGCYIPNYGKLMQDWSDGSKNLLGAGIAIGGIMLLVQLSHKKNQDNDNDSD